MKSDYLTEEVLTIAEELAMQSISTFESLQIATKIQQNRILSEAFVTDRDCPSALEAIAMELGAAKDGSSIKNALYNLALKID